MGLMNDVDEISLEPTRRVFIFGTNGDDSDLSSFANERLFKISE